MLKLRKIFRLAAAAVCCGLLPFGCVREELSMPDAQRNVAVRLDVGTRAVDAVDGTPANEESALHSLRVYAFVKGKLVGHEFRNGDMAAPTTFWMDLAMTSLTTETVDFYLVANEAAMTGANYRLSENTTETQLKNLWFTGIQSNIQQYGLPMFCDGMQVELDFSKVRNESPTDPDHADHPWIEHEDITFELKRPFGKLGVFAAKTEGETAMLRVTGLTMLESGTRMRNYLMTPTPEQLAGITNYMGSIELPVVEGEVTATLAGDITLPEKQNPENYTPVLDAPFYPFESPYANGGAWNIPGSSGKENVLKIDYEFGNEARTGYVYMPEIVRNAYYTVCCLMHNDGKITVEYTVADWDDGGKYEIEFNYPQYTNPIQPEDGSTLTGNARYAQPEVYFSATDAGSYTFKFRITGPSGQKWTPTLVGTLGTPENFSIRVYQGSVPATPEGYLYDNTRENNDPLVASPDPYYITVTALKPANEGEDVGLGISYDRSWSSDGSALLLINGLTNNLKWEGSPVAEVIMIRQTESKVSTIND